MYSDKVLFSGFYGRRNTGDDAFGIVSTWGANHYWGISNAALLSTLGPNCSKINIRYALAEHNSPKKELIDSFIKTLQSDYSLLAGGSILHSKPRLLSARRFMYMLNRINAVKTGAIGVSLGPYKTLKNKLAIYTYLKRFEFLTLRDKSSYEEACTLDLPYAPVFSADLAFLLTQIYKEELSSISRKENILGITLCHSERYTNGDLANEQRRETKLFETISELSKIKSIKFRFFIFNDNHEIGDRPLTELLLREIFNNNHKQYEIIEYSDKTLETLLKIAECQVMLTTRLHGAIFSAVAQVPALLVEYHKKCTDYLNDIAIANEHYLGDMTIPTHKAVGVIKDLMNQKGYDNFYPNRNELIKRAQKSFTDVPLYKGDINK